MQQLQRSGAESLVKLVESGAIKPGSVFQALVTNRIDLKSAPQALMTMLQTDDKKHDAQPPTKNQTPEQALKNQALTKLLAQPKLNAVELKVLNLRQWVITNQSLPVGQSVQVQLREDHQLQLLKLPTSTPDKLKTFENSEAKTPAKPPFEPSNFSTATYSKKRQSMPQPAPAADIKNLPSLDSIPNNKVQQKNLESAVIRHYLRQTLPYGQNLSQVMQQLRRVLVAAEKMTPDIRLSILEPKIWQKLESLAGSTISPKQLQQVSMLKNAVKNSGVFAEAIQLSQQGTGSPPKQPVQASRSSPEVKQPAALDTKLLLAELEKLTSSGNANPPSPIQPSPKPLAPNSSLLFHTLNQLQGFESKTKQTQDYAHTAKQQIHSLVRSALLQITGQQLQQLLAQNSEAAPLNHSAMIEIPVRISEQVLPLTLFIEEKAPFDEDDESLSDEGKTSQEKKANKQWRVFLEFDLADKGKFASEIKLVGNQVQATFWSENRHLRSQAQEQLQTLKQKMQASGIEVSDMKVLQHQPPKRQTSLGYSLVNVTT